MGMREHRHCGLVVCVLAGLALCCTPRLSFGLIEVQEGNSPVQNTGWPSGTEKVANLPCRLGFWVGPPFGGTEYHFVYRCKDTAEFNAALVAFAAIRPPRLEVLVHDGPNTENVFGIRAGEGKEKKPVDWTLTVCRPESWHHLFNNPKVFFDSDHPSFRKPVPPPRIDVYIGGGAVVWEQVKVPENVRMIDKRAESAPVKPVGGGVLRGDIYDMSTGQVIAGAEVALVKRDDKGKLEEAIRTQTNEQGFFEIQKIPAGYYEIRIRAKGYASRWQGSYDNKGNTYHEFDAELIRGATLKGTVTDRAGKPIPGVKVSAMNTLGIDGLGYPCVGAEPVTTDDQGRFELRSLPRGFAQIRCQGESLYQLGAVVSLYDVPSDHITIVMTRTGVIRGKVLAEEKDLQAGIHVHLEQVGRRGIGSWGGSMQCGKDGSFEFKGVPPGEYTLGTKPILPGVPDDPDAVPVVVKEGETEEFELIK